MNEPAADPASGKALPSELTQLATTPALPVEGPLVRAVRGLEATRGHIETLLLMLEAVPDAAAQIEATASAVVETGNAALAAVRQFSAIRSGMGEG